jgi:methylmalonyl-CoA mutase N-terminal domain/subunit
MRTTMQALAAVLGGCQSLHTNSLDEAYALPSEHAVTIALRTQQILAHETGIPEVPDPLGGSYYIEWLTNEVERGAQDYIRSIDEMGGMIPAIERGFPQQQIANASFRYQRAVETNERVIVGVNTFQEKAEGQSIDVLEIDESAATAQCDRLAALRRRRDSDRVRQSLEALQRGAAGSENTMPLILDAVRAYATLGEICEAMRQVFGSWEETSVW